MDTQALLNAYHASRNGTDHYYRHPLSRRFLYSDGIKEMAEAGCYWLVDLLATELPDQFRKRPQYDSCVVTFTVKDTEGRFRGDFEDGDKTPWRRKIDYTDMPDGTFKFFVGRNGEDLVAILLSEY